MGCLVRINIVRKTYTFANSVEPDEMASHQDLHCLLFGLGFFIETPPSATMDMSKIKDGEVYFRNLGG